MKYKFPLATSSWDENEINALYRVIESDRYSMGSEVSNLRPNSPIILVRSLRLW